MPSFAFVILFQALFTFAVPISNNHAIDTSRHCGQWDTGTARNYHLLLNQWGASGETSGSQCAHITGLRGNTVSWTTTYDWAGGDGIKTFTNIQLDADINIQLSAIRSIPASWTWSISTNSIVADVAFDLFLSDSAGGSNVNELMIWLANFNSSPISDQYNSLGTAQEVASKIPIAGHKWSLYSGSNGYNNVYSFLPSSGTIITSFHGDIYPFFKYLVKNQGVALSQYLITAQAGTEVTTGSATFTTSAYSLEII